MVGDAKLEQGATATKMVLKRLVKTAKASKDLDWDGVAALMTDAGMPISGNHLAVKVSRGTLKATEFLCLMRVLGHSFIDLSSIPR
jgi:hypothetical protein